MLYDRHHITTESDMHGECCPVCQLAPCTVNVYVTNPDGEGDTRHTCEGDVCIGHTLDVHHHGDDTPTVEVSTAPMPWTQAGATAAAVAA